jgi:hypothetical protein
MPALGQGLDPSELTACFAEIDTDNSGTLSVDEVHAYFGDKLKLTKDTVNRLLWEIDQNGDGEVDIDELRTSLTARSTFRKRASIAVVGKLFEAVVGAVVPPKEVEGFSDLRRHILVDFDFSPGGMGRACNERFSSPATGCQISRVENRGINLAALRSLNRHVSRRCRNESWLDAAGCPLEPESVSWYDAIAYAIKPATEKSQLSYAEFACNQALPPSWFCIHSWGGEYIATPSAHPFPFSYSP